MHRTMFRTMFDEHYRKVFNEFLKYEASEFPDNQLLDMIKI